MTKLTPKKLPYFDQIMTKKRPFFESERENNDQKMTFFKNFFKKFKNALFLGYFYFISSYNQNWVLPDNMSSN